MKKIIRLFIFIFTIASTSVIAQNPVEIYDQTNNLVAGKPFTLGDELNAFNFSAAYPNPASGSISLEYNIPFGSSGKIMLRNLLGSIVRKVNLEKSEGIAVISTNDLKDGLYFYSVILNNKIEVTRKLVIKH